MGVIEDGQKFFSKSKEGLTLFFPDGGACRPGYVIPSKGTPEGCKENMEGTG